MLPVQDIIESAFRKGSTFLSKSSGRDILAEDGIGWLRVVDEGIAVPLVLVDAGGPLPLEGVHRILLVPLQEGLEAPHLALAVLRLARGEAQEVVADRHVEEDAGDVPAMAPR